MMEFAFFSSIFVIIFVYGLYGPVMMVFRKFFKNQNQEEELDPELPSISLIIPAFNEGDWIEPKIQNSLFMEYPEGKLEVIVVTDGSTDQTNQKAANFKDQIVLLHENERNGKIKAMDRGAKIAKNQILVFTDANTVLNKKALLRIGDNFRRREVGMVAGEKKVLAIEEGESAQGEGFYWKYESWLKKLDSEVSSVIGAAGELFAMRQELYETLPDDTLLDDFMLSTRVVEKGYRVAYESGAYAIEYGSASYRDEWKRKVRICAGGVQSVIRSYRLFNFKKYGLRSFSFVVHRASRWTIAPLALLSSFILSGMMAHQSTFYLAYFGISLFSLLLTWVSVRNNQKNLPKPLLLIVYFIFMHASAIAGWIRYASKSQSVNWERAVRLSQV